MDIVPTPVIFVCDATWITPELLTKEVLPVVRPPAIITFPDVSIESFVAPPTVPPVSILKISESESSTPIVNSSVPPIWKLKCGSPELISISISPPSLVSMVPSNNKLDSPLIALAPVTVTTVLSVLPVNTVSPETKLDFVIYFISSGSSLTSNNNTKSSSAIEDNTSLSVNISSSICVAFTFVSNRLALPKPPLLYLLGIYLPHMMPRILALVDPDRIIDIFVPK